MQNWCSMRLIPPIPHDGATGSEKKVAFLLGQVALGSDAYALSSLNLAEHEYQRWGEIDFLVIFPQGVLAIEVKGGQVGCTNGVWEFEDRLGRVVRKAISPIAQAQGGYSSLVKNYLKPALPRLAAKATSGFCALLPAASRSSIAHLLGTSEMPDELVGTKEDCRDVASLKAFLSRVVLYWERHLGRKASILSSAEVKSMVSTLRPSVDRVAPLSLSLSKVRDEQFALTEGQYNLLDHLEAYPRILCTGGAGNGKTFIAVESMRREMHENPVLVTGTDLLAKHLRESNVADPSRIYSFSELDANRARLGGAFGMLVVDEGQQVTNDRAFALFSEILGRPFHEARWRWFADPNHQVSSTSEFHAEAQARLESWCSVHPTLKENCRNTTEIVRAVEFMTGTRLGNTRVKGKGPDVEYAKVSGRDQLIASAAARIRKWVDEDEIPAGEIVLLSMVPVALSSIPEIAQGAGVDFAHWQPGWDLQSSYPRKLGASTIEDFRGIEAPAVVLCDIHGDLDELARAFYLGMTRANFGVFVACDQSTSALLAMKCLGLQPSTDQ